MCLQYMKTRLATVRGETVRKELTALRQFVGWCWQSGFVPGKVTVPSVPKRAIGTAFAVRRRSAAIELSPEECAAICLELPDWSSSLKVARFPIRARFVVAYETSLRPATLDAIEAGVHYRVGSSSITLTPELDKSRWQREVPLSAAARTALDAVCPNEGLIFGKHDYRPHLRAAALAALPKDRAEKFCGAHLRSARITHWLEKTANLPGTQYLAGHKHAVTTSRYVRASLRAALEVLQASEPKPVRRRKNTG
jgi:integrase